MDEVLGRSHTETKLTETGRGLVVEHISRAFNSQRAVDDVSFEVQPGELVALVGASGSGKTTTLRMVAGYEQPDSGRILFDGENITRLSPARRGFGMVFQHYALFPHMSVADNVAFGLEARGMRRAERRSRATAALARVGLDGKGLRMVQQLSGGEQQRVALARAAVIDPRLLLLDEPLSNLDPTLRQSTRDELRTTLKESGAPALFVTHDQDDAFAIADRIVLLSAGRVLQIGTPEDLYDRPATREVASFIGHATLIPGRRETNSAIVTIAGITHTLALSSAGGLEDMARGAVVLRPEAAEITTDGDADSWRAIVSGRRFAGAEFVYRLRLDDELELDVASRDRLEVGAESRVRITRAVPMVP